jgi:hypothetical protein
MPYAGGASFPIVPTLARYLDEPAAAPSRKRTREEFEKGDNASMVPFNPLDAKRVKTSEPRVPNHASIVTPTESEPWLAFREGILLSGATFTRNLKRSNTHVCISVADPTLQKETVYNELKELRDRVITGLSPRIIGQQRKYFQDRTVVHVERNNISNADFAIEGPTGDLTNLLHMMVEDLAIHRSRAIEAWVEARVPYHSWRILNRWNGTSVNLLVYSEYDRLLFNPYTLHQASQGRQDSDADVIKTLIECHVGSAPVAVTYLKQLKCLRLDMSSVQAAADVFKYLDNWAFDGISFRCYSGKSTDR